jgi:hypothetical protein
MAMIEVTPPQILLDQVDRLKDYADTAISNANDYIEELKNTLLESEDIESTIEYDWPEPSVDYNMLANRPKAPSIESITIDPDDITDPVVPDLDDLVVPDIPDMPVYSITVPNITLPDTPDTSFPDAPDVIPTISSVDLPSYPSFSIPDQPAIEYVSIPSPPDFEVISFEGEELPAIEMNPLEDTFAYSETPYQSDLLEALKAALIDGVENGGTGLGEDAENAIWERARARTLVEIARAREQIERTFASRGWTMPPGSLQAAVTEAIIEETRANADINDKILIEQARLAQANSQFLLTTAAQLESGLMQHFNQVANRALDTAKAAVQFGIETYNANIARYNLLFEKYKLEAAVYEARIRGALSKIENYKASLEGARLTVQTQGQYVDLYRSQLAGVQTLIDLYKSEVQASSVKLETDKMKLDAYRLQVEAFASRVQAATATYGLYRAQIEGESAKVAVYSEQVRAYTARVQATSAYIEGIKTQIEAQALPSEQKLKSYSYQIERMKADIALASSQVESIAKAYGYEVQEYEQDVRAALADAEAQVDVWKGRVQQARNQTDVLVENARQQFNAYVQNRSLTIEAEKSIGNIYAQLAASSMSALHAQLSYGTSMGGSVSASESSTSSSSSASTSYEHRHTYKEK